MSNLATNKFLAEQKLWVHTQKVERRQTASARSAKRYALSRRGLLAGMAITLGTAALMPGAKAAFEVDIIDIKRLGARGDGVTLDTAVLQRAWATGQHVYLPPGNYLTASPLVAAAPGQRFFGAGLSQSIITAATGFVGTQLLDFNQFQNGGPQIADLALTCQTPNSVVFGVQAQNCPRFKINNCRITLFQTGLNASGNSGGADIDGLEIWSTVTNIILDGSEDSITFNKLRIWPFNDPFGTTFTGSISGTTLTVTAATINGIAANQTITGTGVTTCTVITQLTGTTGGAGTYQLSVSQTVASRLMTATGYSYLGATGLSSGRCDGLYITNSLFICLNQLSLFSGNGITATFLGTTGGTTLDVISGVVGFVSIGTTLFIGGTSTGLIILSQSSGTPNGVGLYVLSGSNTTGNTTMLAGFPGSTFGTISNIDFDSFNGVTMSAGIMSVINCNFTQQTGNAGATQSIQFTGGNLTVTGGWMLGGAGFGIAMTGGTLVCNGVNFLWGGNTLEAIGQAGGTAVVSNNIFGRTSGIGGNALITVTGGSRITAIGNRCPIDGSGNFISVATDNFNRVVYNVTGAWTNSFPTATSGIYSPN